MSGRKGRREKQSYRLREMKHISIMRFVLLLSLVCTMHSFHLVRMLFISHVLPIFYSILLFFSLCSAYDMRCYFDPNVSLFRTYCGPMLSFMCDYMCVVVCECVHTYLSSMFVSMYVNLRLSVRVCI